VLDELAALDTDAVAPLDALLLVRQWQKRLRGGAAGSADGTDRSG